MDAMNNAPNAVDRFSRWPGMLTLSLGLLLGPIAALVNEEMIYLTNMWVCGHGAPIGMHIVAVVCLLVAIAAGLLARADWGRVGRGTESESAMIDSRTRFLALGGMAVSALSALLIVMQWLAVFVFGPCVRS
ncbi:MAG TPA: hypothetical protein VGH98_21135 [Gemmatimonadaceae bacterium]|jgi:hypothetical protein